MMNNSECEQTRRNRAANRDGRQVTHSWKTTLIVRQLLVVCACWVGLTSSVHLVADDGVDYLKQIKPILRERCFSCHGALKQEAELRLDTAELMIRGGDSGAAITPNDPAASLLLQRVSAGDIDERMPPEGEGEKLTDQQLQLIRDWIIQGAPAPEGEQPETNPKDHWAFRPVSRPPVPSVRNSGWVRNPIDAFLARQHEQQGLTPQAEPSRTILLRRLYFDLIGIPPTADEITAFENDRSAQWYDKTVERLLQDPRHGERWARHWMDIWRYSDWWGLGQQLRRSQKHIWHWRDWIVESLNEDTPYDEMVRLMLAADEFYPNDLQKLRATGFLARNYWLFNRNQWMDETVEHVSKGFLGLTMNCTKCHAHKYDPFEHVDYYRMRAFFEPYHVRLDVLPGEPNLTRDGIPRVFDGLLDTPTYRFVRGQESNPDKSVAVSPGVPEIIAFNELTITPVSLPSQAWQPVRRPWVIDDQLAAARSKLKSAQMEVEKLRKELTPTPTEQEEQANQEVTPPEAAETSEAERKLNVAEAAAELVAAELDSLERRAKAMRAEWAQTDTTTPAVDDREKTIIAIRAERKVAVVQARHSIAVAELAALRAENDKKDAAEKKVKAARESLEKALENETAEIKETDQFTPLVGAKWTPTRFLFSGKDDPTVEFVPQSSGRRSALAKWITDRRNPLTARVAVNHIWMRHMDAPLVPTVFDFGRKGIPPANPELLDWLAAEFVDHGWSMKHLHRLITTSAAYRMGSSKAGGQANQAKDPDNRYWWRRESIRLESQLVRDSILAHAGKLDPTLGGPTVPAAQQAKSTRRSLYLFHSNNDRNPFLTMFDEASVTECYRREQSVVPQQALALTNSQLVLDSAPKIAERLSAGQVNDTEFIRKSFLVLLGIAAEEAKVTAGLKALNSWRELPDGSTDDARAKFVWALINHNDFVTLR